MASDTPIYLRLIDRFQLVTWQRVKGLLAALALTLLWGCGQADPPQVPVFPISGKVMVAGGEVPNGARIVLYAERRSDALPAGLSPSGSVQKDGTFKIGTYGPDDGAPSGEYKATIEWFKLVETPEESYNGPNVLSKEYAKPDSTPLRFKVTNSPTEVPPIVLPLKKK